MQYMPTKKSTTSAEYLINLFELRLPSEPTNIKVFENLYLSNNPKTIENFFTEQAIPIAGISEVKQTYELRTFITSSQTHPIKEFNEQKNLIEVLSLASTFCHALWLVKDNSIRTELGHLKYDIEGGKTLHSNYLTSMYSNSLAKKEPMEFSIVELEEAVDHFNRLYEISYINLSPVTNLRKDINRITRSFFFIQSARDSRDIGFKISQYCTAFECLFSTSNSELKHRLSETVALFLENQDNEPIEIYKNMQLAYDLRSAIVHGDHISAKFSKNDFKLLKETSVNCDDYLRAAYKKILYNKDLFELYTKGSNSEISERTMNLIFNKSI